MATIRKLKKIAFPTENGTAVFDSDDFVCSVNNIKPDANGNVNLGASIQPSITGSITLNSTNNTVVMTDIVTELSLEVGDVIQLKTDNGYNKLHTVEQLIEQDFNVEGSFNAGRNDCPNMVWTGFASFDDKMTGVIASGYNKKLYKLVNANWVEWEESTQRLWTGLTKMNGVIYGCVFGGGIFKINPDGTDEQLTLTNRNWNAIYSKDGVMYAAISGLRVYQIDIENLDEEERDSIDNILTNVNRNNYSGIYVEGDYLYYNYDNALIWRKDLTSEDNEVAVSAGNNWKSNFVEYEGEVYIFGRYGLTYQLVGNEFITLETKLISTTDYVWGAAVIDGHLLVGPGASNRTSNRAETYLRIPYKQGEVILNYEHSGVRSNGSLKLPNYTGQATVTQIAKWFNAPIGLGQAWVNVSRSRASGTTYTNTTGKPIKVAAGARGRDAHIDFYVNGICVSSSRDLCGSEHAKESASEIVPNGATYNVVSGTLYGISVNFWSELR